jgi:putative hydrolase of the HAD superfamily
MIRNIIFDMGGVLVDIDRERCVEAFRRIGFPEADQMLDCYSQKGVFGDLESGRVTPAEFFDWVRSESRSEITDGQIAGALDEFITGLPVYKLQMLRDLRRRFGVYMLSNTNAVMLPSIRARYFTQLPPLTFDDYFDRAFLSYEMGCIKPADEIFHMMVAQGGFTPAECLFIDDGQANVDTAARLGFHTYLARAGEDFRHIFDSL